jgi:hypothetical protein
MKGKRNQRTKRQHYVPRCCLGRFSKDGDNVWVFDKFTRKQFRAGVMGVAQENGFYDLPPAVLDNKAGGGDGDSQLAEKALSRIEESLNRATQRLIDEAQAGRMLDETRRQVALHAVLQWLRTREQREAIFEGHQKVMQALADAICKKNFPDLPTDQYPRVVCERDNLPAVHVGYLFSEDRIAEYATHLMGHIWVLGVNETIQPFYTSDHPVVKKFHAQHPGEKSAGIRRPGIELAFPLSSRYILVMYDRAYFPEMLPQHGRAVRITPSGVDHYNGLQALKSYRQVYCESDQFEQAIGVCDRHPSSCTPERQRMEITENDGLIESVVKD